LFDSEVFSHGELPGLMESANGGTFLISEVGELSLRSQADLMRVLMNRQFSLDGYGSAQLADIRVIAETQRDLETEASWAAFRQDLLARLSGLIVKVPPLRERRSEILELATIFISERAGALRRAAPALSPEAAAALAAYDWPSNVRELRLVIEAAIDLSDALVLDVDRLIISR